MEIMKIKLNKKKIIGGLCVLVALVVVILMLASAMGNTVKVLMLEGTITESYTQSTGITPKLVDKWLDGSKSAEAIVIRINSPGGSVVASQEILDSLKKFKQETGIPVVFSIGEMGASGAYYIATGADAIVASEGSLVGSIGVISEFIYMDELLKKLGLEREIIKSGKYKDLGAKSMSEEERNVIQVLSNDVYEQFIEQVASGRKMPLEKVRELATGEVFTGRQAKELGLVDETGSLEDAVELAAKLAEVTKYKVKTTYPGGLFAGLFGMLSDLRGLFKEQFSLKWQMVL